MIQLWIKLKILTNEENDIYNIYYNSYNEEK